jgi:hypothetical protein
MVLRVTFCYVVSGSGSLGFCKVLMAILYRGCIRGLKWQHLGEKACRIMGAYGGHYGSGCILGAHLRDSHLGFDMMLCKGTLLRQQVHERPSK